jgi:hypothetical protein
MLSQLVVCAAVMRCYQTEQLKIIMSVLYFWEYSFQKKHSTGTEHLKQLKKSETESAANAEIFKNS